MGNIKNNTLIYSDSLLVDENTKSLDIKFSEALKNNFISKSNPLNFMNDNFVSAYAMLFKKELLEYIFPFPESVYFDAWIAANASLLNGIVYFDKCLVLYRQHSTNTLSKHNKKSKSNNLIRNKAQKILTNKIAKLEVIKCFLKLKLLTKDDKELRPLPIPRSKSMTHDMSANIVTQIPNFSKPKYLTMICIEINVAIIAPNL